MIMHVDMDAFFAAIEQRDDPTLRGQPVIVGARPGGRGVVSTCSYEARRYGIHSAMPIAEAVRRCPHGRFLRPDFRRYREASRAVMAALGDISPVVEPVSVDEAVVDISGLGRLWGPPAAIGEAARRRIREAVNLTASVGIGPNRVIAKIASEARKPDGLTVVLAGEVREFLAPLPVSDLRGVGRKTTPILHRLGLRTIGDLQRCDPARLRGFLGPHQAEALLRQALGEASDVVGLPAPRKSISKETTFATDVRDEETLRETLLVLAAGVGRSARRKGLYGRVVTLKVRLSGFETHTRRQRQEEPVHGDLDIGRTGWELYRTSPYTGRPVRLIGVGLAELVSEGSFTPSLLGLEARHRDQQLYRVLDAIQDRFGDGVIALGGRQRDKPRLDDED